MRIVLLEDGGTTRVARDDAGLRLFAEVSRAQTLRFATTLRDADAEALAGYLGEEPVAVSRETLADAVAGEASFPRERLVRVQNPAKGPYFVKEGGWWRVRGAQPLHESEEAWRAYLDAYDAWVPKADPESIPELPYGDDLVRVHLAPGDAPALQPWGYIDGHARPGWGSQMQMLLGEVSATGCTARVLTVTPYVYAPRVDFADRFTEARVNGAPWAYHDGRHVFLPQRPGDYLIEVARGGEATPTVATTTASVERARFEGDTLSVGLGLPAYVFKVPDALRYHLLVAFDPKRTLVAAVDGGEAVRQGERGAVVRCDAMEVTVRFRPV